MQSQIEHLNAHFAIAGQLHFEVSPGGLIAAIVENRAAQAVMTLAGAHVMAYRRASGPDGLTAPLLWASPSAASALDERMRGGAPVCWPWFAAHPNQPETLPLHGFARALPWDVTAARALDEDTTEIRMTLAATPATLAVWPHAFTLELRAVFGERLTLEWTARNPGERPYTYTGAIHPYFAVSDSRAVSVRGLEHTGYLDKNEAYRRKTLPGELRFAGPVDCVFLDTTRPLLIADPGLRRAIHIEKTGSRTTVVWNPHDDDALQPDVGAGNHRQFICAEAANAFDDAVTVAPGAEARLGMQIWVEPLPGKAARP